MHQMATILCDVDPIMTDEIFLESDIVIMSKINMKYMDGTIISSATRIIIE
jgi:hypothetical protein